MMQHRVSEQEYNKRVDIMREKAYQSGRSVSAGFELNHSQFAERVNGVPYAWRTVSGCHDNVRFYLLK